MEQWPEPQVPPATILHLAITSWSTHLRCLAVILPHQTMACKQDAYSLVLPPRTHLYSSSMLVECTQALTMTPSGPNLMMVHMQRNQAMRNQAMPWSCLTLDLSWPGSCRQVEAEF